MGGSEHPTELETIILLAVARLEGLGYGVTIREEIQRVAERDVSVGSVYQALDRLEGRGLVESREGEPTPVRGGRAPRHFRITAAGAGAVTAARAMMERLWSGLELDGGVA